jgi:hypothetical protein
VKRIDRALVALCCVFGLVLAPVQIASAATQGEAIVNAAASQAGVPYCEPGGSLNGPTACGGRSATFDCSGLAMYAVYQGTGGRVALPHGAGMDHVAGGVPVSRANLQPGDLVFFGPGFNGADFHHVGIFAGNGMMWDANTGFWIYPDGVHERSLASIETELGFDGAVRYWSGNTSGGGGIGEESYIQVSGHGEVFKIVGGAPLYVSTWNAVGGPQPVTTISQQQFDSLRPYPADGTLVNTTNDGRVYEFAGGAPLYVSSWSAIGGPKATIPIDGWDVANPGNPAAHLREYPADGTLINTTDDGGVYEIAGGAPLYLSSWSAIGGSRPSVGVDGWDVANAGNPYAHLRPYPADGTFLNTSAGRVYQVAGGAPIAVSSWSVFGGVQPYATVDQWDVDNVGNPYSHLLPAPLDGTVVEGLPSHSHWLFGGGLRTASPVAAGAVPVDDAGLTAFPVRSSVDGASGAAPTSSAAPTASRGPGAGVAAAKRSSKKRRTCHKIKNRHERARCASAPGHRKQHVLSLATIASPTAEGARTTTFVADCGSVSFLATRPHTWSGGCTAGSGVVKALRWSRYDPRRAVATGLVVVGESANAAAHTKARWYKARFVMSDPRACRDRSDWAYFYTERLTITYPAHNPWGKRPGKHTRTLHPVDTEGPCGLEEG